MTGRVSDLLQIAALLLLPFVERFPAVLSSAVYAQESQVTQDLVPADTAEEIVEPLLQLRPSLREVVGQADDLTTTGLSNDVRASLSDTRIALFEARVALADLRGQLVETEAIMAASAPRRARVQGGPVTMMHTHPASISNPDGEDAPDTGAPRPASRPGPEP